MCQHMPLIKATLKQPSTKIGDTPVLAAVEAHNLAVKLAVSRDMLGSLLGSRAITTAGHQ